jgi:hypothetical protein
MTRSAARRPANLLACAPRLVPSCAANPRNPGVVEGLVGRRIPPVVLQECCGSPLNLGEFARWCSLVLYFYPGNPGSLDGEDALHIDGIEHRAFRDRGRELSALGFQAIGLARAASRVAHRERVRDAPTGYDQHQPLIPPSPVRLERRQPQFPREQQLRVTQQPMPNTVGQDRLALGACGLAADQAIAWILIHSGWPGAGVDAS